MQTVTDKTVKKILFRKNHQIRGSRTLKFGPPIRIRTPKGTKIFIHLLLKYHSQ